MRQVLALTTALGVSLTAQEALPPYTLTDLGVVAGATTSVATGISADRSTVVGLSQVPQQSAGFRWTRANGIQAIPGMLPTIKPIAVNANGTAMACTGVIPGGAYRWTSPGSLVQLAGLPSVGNAPISASIDASGLTIAGRVSGIPFGGHMVSWPAGGTSIVDLYPTLQVDCTAVSSDGLTFVGRMPTTTNFPPTTHASRFRAGVLLDLGAIPDTASSEALGVSGDGAVVVGYSNPTGFILSHEATVPAVGMLAFRWNELEGMQPLPMLPSWSGAIALAVSADGRVTVGSALVGGAQHACLWLQPGRPFDLGSQVTCISPLLLERAIGVARDTQGISIAGTGRSAGVQRAWLLELPPDSDTDTDGDGLVDDWENNGIPFLDGCQTRRHLLPGAQANAKDLYVEVDAMQGRAMRVSTVVQVNAAFASHGITLHLDVDDTNLPLHDYPNTFADFQLDKLGPLALPSPQLGWFGTNAERALPDWSSRRVAKLMAYRYCVFGEGHSNGASVGLAEQGGDDFMVTLGSAFRRQNHPASAEIEAGIFMHELGHSLGLTHGGWENEPGPEFEFKPNYFSVMNPLWMTPSDYLPSGTQLGEWNRYFPNFSPTQLATINESNLSEQIGINGPDAQITVPFSVPAGSFCPGYGFPCSDPAFSSCVQRASAIGPVDWDGNCIILPSPFTTVGDVNVLNRFRPVASPGQVLRGHDDWSTLHFSFRDSPWVTQLPDVLHLPSEPTWWSSVTISFTHAYMRIGDGCPGTLGVPRIDASQFPRVGFSFSTVVDRLPDNAALLIFGFSSTTSPFGPLPIDLGLIGMPGCLLYVSDDLEFLLIGANNIATLTTTVPNNPALAGVQVFAQAAVLDHLVGNAIGVVMSEAGATIIRP